MHSFLDVGDFVHHLLVNGQTAGGIDDDDVLALRLGVLDGVLRNLHRVLVALFAIDLHLDLLAQHLQLLDSGRTIDVASHKQHLLAALAFQVRGQFGGESGLTRALQTCDEDDTRLAFQVDINSVAAHEFGQLVVHDFDHHVARLHRGKYLLAKGFLFDVVGNILGNLIADVGVQEGATDLLHRVGNIDFGYKCLSSKDFERAFQFFA